MFKFIILALYSCINLPQLCFLCAECYDNKDRQRSNTIYDYDMQAGMHPLMYE